MKSKLIILTVTLLTVLPSLIFSQTKAMNTTKPTIIFVHGLWADGSCWNKIIPSLISEGYNVISVQNPTTSIEDDVAATERAIELAKGDVVLVGHSWGGFVITEAGDNPKVKCLVYVNAFAPDKGETVPTLSTKAVQTKLSDYFVPLNGFISLIEEGVKMPLQTICRQQNKN
jgi:pimeloyl-ACP methyl ester carboxylesterase